MFRVLSIDPGNDAGWSFWEDGRVVACGLGRAMSQRATPDLILVELPMVYPDRKVPPRDLIVLSLTAGRHVERVRTIEHIRNGGAASLITALAVFPRTWKGTLDKDMMVRRIQTMVGPMNHAKVVADMDAQGIPAGKRHNVWDGVGLGHWAIVQAMTGAKLGKDPVTSVTHMADYVFMDL